MYWAAGQSPGYTLRAFGALLPLRAPDRTKVGFRSTALVHDLGTVHGVEHVFAALHALSVYDAPESLQLTLESDESSLELPLLGGGALEYFDACRPYFGAREVSEPGGLVSDAARSLAVVRAASYELGDSTYTFLPCDRFETEVTFVGKFDEEISATWSGDPTDFRERIAPARTFLWRSEIAELSDRVANVEPGSVCVLEDDARLSDDEPARHKLLDLLGDLFPFAILPKGRLVARRPGHAKNLEVFRMALADGVLCSAK